MGNANNAYITKQANTVNPSDWINKQEQIGLQYDAIARQEEKEKQDREDQVIKDDLSLKWDYSTSGNSSYDEFLAGAGNQMIPKFSAAKQKAIEALQKYGQHSKEYNSAVATYTNIADTIPQLKMMHANTVDGLKANEKLMVTGNYVQHPDNIKTINEFKKGDYQFRINENGLPRIKKGSVSLNGKDFKGLDLKDPIEKLYAKDVAEDLAKIWGESEIQTREGYVDYTNINSVDDIVDKKTGKKYKGLRSTLLDFYNENVTEDDMERYYATEKNEFLEFDGEKVSENDIKQKQVDFINHLVETTIPLIKKKSGQKFDSASSNKDKSIAEKNKDKNNEGSSSFTHIEDTYHDGNYHTSVYAPAEPIVPKNTNKAANPVTYDGIIYDDESKTISLTGRKLTNNNKSPEFTEYKKRAQEASKAYIAWNNNKDEAIEEQLMSEYLALESQVDIALESLKTVKGAWEETTVTDKRQVATLLKGTLNANSYDEMVKILSRKEKQKEKQKEKESEETERPNLEELPDLP